MTKIYLKRKRGRDGQYKKFQNISSGNLLGTLYPQLLMGIIDTNFGRVLSKNKV